MLLEQVKEKENTNTIKKMFWFKLHFKKTAFYWYRRLVLYHIGCSNVLQSMKSEEILDFIIIHWIKSYLLNLFLSISGTGCDLKPSKI